jgi:hypothetical protein
MSSISDTEVPRGKSRVHAILWPTLLVLAAVAALAEPGVSRLLPVSARDPLEALAWSAGQWLLGTLAVLLAAALALLLRGRPAMGSALGLAALMVALSTLVEIVGLAARLFLFDFIGGAVEPAAIWALSSTLMAGAWLTARGWRPLALLASPLAGVASWFTIPIPPALADAGDLFGTGIFSVYTNFCLVYALQVLVISVATLTALGWHRVRPTAPLRHSVLTPASVALSSES